MESKNKRIISITKKYSIFNKYCEVCNEAFKFKLLWKVVIKSAIEGDNKCFSIYVCTQCCPTIVELNEYLNKTFSKRLKSFDTKYYFSIGEGNE